MILIDGGLGFIAQPNGLLDVVNQIRVPIR